jgi:hypothetical protein
MIGARTPSLRPPKPADGTVPDSRPGDRRLSRAAIIVIFIVVAIVVTIFVTFNISHYRETRNEVQAENSGRTVP